MGLYDEVRFLDSHLACTECGEILENKVWQTKDFSQLMLEYKISCGLVWESNEDKTLDLLSNQVWPHCWVRITCSCSYCIEHVEYWLKFTDGKLKDIKTNNEYQNSLNEEIIE